MVCFCYFRLTILYIFHWQRCGQSPCSCDASVWLPRCDMSCSMAHSNQDNAQKEGQDAEGIGPGGGCRWSDRRGRWFACENSKKKSLAKTRNEIPPRSQNFRSVTHHLLCSALRSHWGYSTGYMCNCQYRASWPTRWLMSQSRAERKKSKSRHTITRSRSKCPRKVRKVKINAASFHSDMDTRIPNIWHVPEQGTKLWPGN